MAILPTHAGMDMSLFEKIVVCTPEHFTDADCTMTNEQILMMPTHDARALCRKCKFKSLSNSGTLVMKNISTSGSLSVMTKRLLSYFQVYRQQLCLGGPASERAFSLSKTMWLPAEDARLMEIFLDRDYASVTNAAFRKSSRPVLDATDGSPLVAVWTNVVGPLFNNFEKYQPEPRFFSESDVILHQCNPNSTNIPRRVPEHLRSRFATLRSRWTRVYDSGWKKSGHNDPSKFSDYINLQSPLDVSMLWMFDVLHNRGNDLMLRRMSRTVATDGQVDSSNMESTLAHITGRHRQSAEDTEDPTTQTTHIRRTQSFELQQELRSLLESLNQSITAEADSDRIANLEVLHRDRDRAFNSMEQMEQKIRSASTESRKRKYQKEYKHRKGEWIELEKDIAKKRNIPPIDESRFVDDESFMSFGVDDSQVENSSQVLQDLLSSL
jgi:hypothetical protein